MVANIEETTQLMTREEDIDRASRSLKAMSKIKKSACRISLTMWAHRKVIYHSI